ncbi:MAG: PEP-CTERM sorting domain-containing protein [Bryobacteraceae bacterium]
MNISRLIALGAAGAAFGVAAPIQFGTYLYADYAETGFSAQPVSQFSNPVAQTEINNSLVHLISRADLATGTLKTLNQRLTGFGSTGTQVLFYDTITFNGSAFQGSFGATYDLTLTATFDGSFNRTGAIDSGGVGGRIQVYGGSTVIDSSVFADADSLTNFLFLGGPTPVCAQGVNGPDLATFTGPFTFSTSCTVTVSAANPTVRILLNLPSFVNGNGASWQLNMLNSATLSLGDLGGREVFSASGVLPGTLSAVPEPATLGLVVMGGLLCGWRKRQTQR